MHMTANINEKLEKDGLPVRHGTYGVRYDFNDGARVWVPEGKGRWRIEITDDETGHVMYCCESDGGWIWSARKYYTPFLVRVWQDNKSKPVLEHRLELRGQKVLISFPKQTLGDMIAWLPYADRFQRKHGCILDCSVSRAIKELFQAQYSNMRFREPDDSLADDYYATYNVGLYDVKDEVHQPFDYHLVGFGRMVAYILGVDPVEEPPSLRLDWPRTISEPYVCLGTKSTLQAKMWNNGPGWSEVIEYLKNLGYRVLCIDLLRIHGESFVWNQFPHGAEDFTGERPLMERVALLQHADFFVGLSSGLSWLAWATRIPVVMISGFTLPWSEFPNPYRVYNTMGCGGCWDDLESIYDRRDFFSCPRHKGTSRQFECTINITGRQVINCIERLRRDRGLKLPRERNLPDKLDFLVKGYGGS